MSPIVFESCLVQSCCNIAADCWLASLELPPAFKVPRIRLGLYLLQLRDVIPTEQSDNNSACVAEMAALLAKRAPNLAQRRASTVQQDDRFQRTAVVLPICATPKQQVEAEAFLASKAAEVTHYFERENQKRTGRRAGPTERREGREVRGVQASILVFTSHFHS